MPVPKRASATKRRQKAKAWTLNVRGHGRTSFDVRFGPQAQADMIVLAHSAVGSRFKGLDLLLRQSKQEINNQISTGSLREHEIIAMGVAESLF